MDIPDHPAALKSPELLHTRTMRLSEPHLLPLMEWREKVKQQHFPDQDVEIPAFDSLSGGVHSRILLLFRSPNRHQLIEGGTGLVSCDNPDPVSENVFTAMQLSSLSRKQTLLWNLVPWHLKHGGKATPEETALGNTLLQELLALLPRLEVVITHGNTTKDTLWGNLSNPIGRKYMGFYTRHPSPQNHQKTEGAREGQLRIYRQAQQFLQQKDAFMGTLGDGEEFFRITGYTLQDGEPGRHFGAVVGTVPDERSFLANFDQKGQLENLEVFDDLDWTLPKWMSLTDKYGFHYLEDTHHWVGVKHLTCSGDVEQAIERHPTVFMPRPYGT